MASPSSTPMNEGDGVHGIDAEDREFNNTALFCDAHWVVEVGFKAKNAGSAIAAPIAAAPAVFMIRCRHGDGVPVVGWSSKMVPTTRAADTVGRCESRETTGHRRPWVAHGRGTRQWNESDQQPPRSRCESRPRRWGLSPGQRRPRTRDPRLRAKAMAAPAANKTATTMMLLCANTGQTPTQAMRSTPRAGRCTTMFRHGGAQSRSQQVAVREVVEPTGPPSMRPHIQPFTPAARPTSASSETTQ